MVRFALPLLCCTLVLAGCLGVGTMDSAAEAPCQNVEPVGEDFANRSEVDYETASGFRLNVTPETVPRGENFTVRLQNVADTERSTGTRRRYTVQRWTDGEWVPVLGGAGAYNATMVVHGPGEGFVWRFTADRAGLTANRIEACGPLRPGRYRFVYFGTGDPAVAARFTVTET